MIAMISAVNRGPAGSIPAFRSTVPKDCNVYLPI